LSTAGRRSTVVVVLTVGIGPGSGWQLPPVVGVGVVGVMAARIGRTGVVLQGTVDDVLTVRLAAGKGLYRTIPTPGKPRP